MLGLYDTITKNSNTKSSLFKPLKVNNQEQEQVICFSLFPLSYAYSSLIKNGPTEFYSF